MKALVVYYSRADENYNVGNVEVGNTEILAKKIAAKLGADEFKIEPAVPYPADYQECVEKATEEHNAQARPEYVGEIDTSEYDTIFLGYPIWWGDLPMVVYTWLENHDLSGKTIVPFNTHEGSGNSGTYEMLKAKLVGADVIGNGFNMPGATARNENGAKQLDDWLEGLGH